MKKQFSMIAAAIITVALYSCSKEKIETLQTGISEEIATKKGGGTPSINLDKALQGLYRFDANLVEATGKLKDAVPSTAGADIYTEDRKGNPNSALQFTGRYGIDISDIPQEVDFTVAVWIKYETGFAPPTNFFIHSNSVSPWFAQQMNVIAGVIATPMTTSVSSILDDHWHHLAASYDGSDLKFYIDGNYIGKSANYGGGGVYPPGFTVEYQAGYMTSLNSTNIVSTWKGNMDDLRFYNRILSAAEVQALYNF